VLGRRSIEIEHWQPTKQLVDLGSVFYRASGDQRTKHQLRGDNGGGSKRGCLLVKLHSEFCRATSKDFDKKIRIEQIAQHSLELRASFRDGLLPFREVNWGSIEEIVPRRVCGNDHTPNPFFKNDYFRGCVIKSHLFWEAHCLSAVGSKKSCTDHSCIYHLYIRNASQRNCSLSTNPAPALPGVVLLLQLNLNLIADRFNFPPLAFSTLNQIANEEPFEDRDQRH
jgi:hypothetical protein